MLWIPRASPHVDTHDVLCWHFYIVRVSAEIMQNRRLCLKNSRLNNSYIGLRFEPSLIGVTSFVYSVPVKQPECKNSGYFRKKNSGELELEGSGRSRPHSGTVVRTLVFDQPTSLSHARTAADGWPLICG